MTHVQDQLVKARLFVSPCPPAPPTLLGSSDVRTVAVPAKGHLTLECQSDSDPPPEIEWYKDDVKLQVRRKEDVRKDYLRSKV